MKRVNLNLLLLIPKYFTVKNVIIEAAMEALMGEIT